MSKENTYIPSIVLRTLTLDCSPSFQADQNNFFRKKDLTSGFRYGYINGYSIGADRKRYNGMKSWNECYNFWYNILKLELLGYSQGEKSIKYLYGFLQGLQVGCIDN